MKEREDITLRLGISTCARFPCLIGSCNLSLAAPDLGLSTFATACLFYHR